MRAMLLGTLAVLVCYPALADDKKEEKIDAKKIIGKWEPKNKKKDEPTVIEFAKDGTFTLTFDLNGKEMRLTQKYNVDGNKIITTEKVDGKEVVVKTIIVKLTDTELVTKDEDGKNEETLVRIKDK
ncbi:hypothetical protein VT84_27030 [Gemmata sp. SH-PL17]|uniref:TIGR03066 family protein n=1 Tax=Gemmata sp. SH-PL17 TaxID=1630693 RepID=UPI0004B63588|nr:TIGR03066 family protein [Gemmata sp. SH-PL17]AMV28089.1 hypothetical protein VT84_27030 [Gemmata sp. SH-PL17]